MIEINRVKTSSLPIGDLWRCRQHIRLLTAFLLVPWELKRLQIHTNAVAYHKHIVYSIVRIPTVRLYLYPQAQQHLLVYPSRNRFSSLSALKSYVAYNLVHNA